SPSSLWQPLKYWKTSILSPLVLLFTRPAMPSSCNLLRYPVLFSLNMYALLLSLFLTSGFPATGRPHMRTELFSAKCPNTIMVQETDQDYQRILFYSRILHLEEHCLADFWNKPLYGLAACPLQALALYPGRRQHCNTIPLTPRRFSDLASI
uniref:Apolipoprotein M n=1 Tax=Laticauda laticaudata TaxID=8630 RepID=A0A8C5WY60_LATLA